MKGVLEEIQNHQWSPLYGEHFCKDYEGDSADQHIKRAWQFIKRRVKVANINRSEKELEAVSTLKNEIVHMIIVRTNFLDCHYIRAALGEQSGVKVKTTYDQEIDMLLIERDKEIEAGKDPEYLVDLQVKINRLVDQKMRLIELRGRTQKDLTTLKELHQLLLRKSEKLKDELIYAKQKKKNRSSPENRKALSQVLARKKDLSQ
jgi:hypothetical protein